MNTDIQKKQVIVSMTSFPAAIPYAVRAVQSILNGSVLPDRLVLYLTFAQFGDDGLPQDLLALADKSPVFEIRNYDRDIRSYRKLIPALQDFPEAVIVTVDDDVDYHKHMLRDLLRLHAQYPDAVLAHRAKRMKPGKPYRQWRKYRWYNFVWKRIHSGFKNIQTGVGGVLYPPHALKSDMLDIDLFTQMAPTTDDIWFWAAAVAHGTPVVPVPFGHNKPKGVGKPRVLSLKTTNFKSGTDRNAAALNAIVERFPEVGRRIGYDIEIDKAQGGMNYYLARDYKCKRINDAGSKARLDIERIMDRLGFLPAGRNSTVHSNRVSHFIVTLAIIVGMVTRVKWGDKLVLQYPVKYYGAICYLAHMRGVSVITLVHDLGCFRHKRSSVRREIRRMNLSDGLIGCNPVVCKWLSNNGYVGYERKRIIESLGAFDFLSESVSPDRKKTWPLRQILYAGQLAWRKNSFLYQYGRVIAGYTVNIYGKGFDKSKAYDSDKFDLKGFLLPDDLIRYSEGDFGLVWDGDSVDSCSGNWGEYLSINTPHKISLYMRCGLPVIIWSKAAMAGFVEENGIGICVNSLRDISEVYEKITYDDYCLMCDNVQRVSRMMSGGGYLSRAVSKVVSRIGNRL